MDFSNIQEEMEIPLKRERLCTRFGPASKILGMEIQRDRKSGTLALSQRRFVEKLLELFGMSKAKPVKTPFAPHFAALTLRAATASA